MPWHAIDELGDALDATKRLLLPFALRHWLVLAVVVFFVSGATGFNPGFSFTFGDLGPVFEGPTEPPGWEDPGWEDPWSGETYGPTALAVPGLAVILLLAGLTTLVAIAAAYVAAVMEFVFVENARTREARIRGFFGSYTRAGAWLFLFRLVVALLVIAPVILIGVLVAVTGGVFLVVVLLLSPVLLLLALGVWLVMRFTDDFVVPVMVAEGVGVLEGWRRFWPALREEWRQYGVYAIVRVLLGIGANTLAGVGFAVVAVVLAVPFLIVGALGVFLTAGVLGADVLTAIVVVGLVLLYVVALVVAGTTFVQVPIWTYLRYYSLLVLGTTTPQYDLLEDVRAEIDAADAPAGGGADDVSAGEDVSANRDATDAEAGENGAGDDETEEDESADDETGEDAPR